MTVSMDSAPWYPPHSVFMVWRKSTLSPLHGAKIVEKAVNAGLAVAPAGIAKLWSLSNPTHEQELLWPKDIKGTVTIVEAAYLRNGFRWQNYRSGGNAISGIHLANLPE